MNGVTGLKPTWGRVSRAGVFALAQSMDHIGPMARTAADAAALLGAIAGPDPDDPTALQNPVPDYLSGIGAGVVGLRIGIDRTLIAAGADADMARATKEAAAVLAQIGALVKEVRFPSPDDVVRVAIPLCSVEAAVAHEATYPSRAGEYGPRACRIAGHRAHPRRCFCNEDAALQGGVPRSPQTHSFATSIC
jgi:amidase